MVQRIIRPRSTLPLWTTTVGVNVTVIENASDLHFRLRVHKLPFDAGDGPASVCDRDFHHDAAYGACDPNAPDRASPAGDSTSLGLYEEDGWEVALLQTNAWDNPGEGRLVTADAQIARSTDRVNVADVLERRQATVG